MPNEVALFYFKLHELDVVAVLVLLAPFVSLDVGITQCGSTHIALYLFVIGLRVFFYFLFSILGHIISIRL